MSTLHGTCAVCDAGVELPQNTEVSEIVTCPDCNNQLVVNEIANKKVTLAEAPEVEEDWGE